MVLTKVPERKNAVSPETLEVGAHCCWIWKRWPWKGPNSLKRVVSPSSDQPRTGKVSSILMKSREKVPPTGSNTDTGWSWLRRK